MYVRIASLVGRYSMLMQLAPADCLLEARQMNESSPEKIYPNRLHGHRADIQPCFAFKMPSQPVSSSRRPRAAEITQPTWIQKRR